MVEICIQSSSTNGSLFTTATTLQLLFFLADGPYIYSCFNLSTTATSQCPLSSVPKVAVVERYNCIRPISLETWNVVVLVVLEGK